MAEHGRAGSRGRGRYVLRGLALAYIGLLVVVPVVLIGWHTFQHGVAPVWKALTDPSVVSAFRVTFIIAAWAVVLNTIFGVGASLLLVRYRFPGRRLLSALVDLPLSVSPVVIGLALVLVYGKYGWIGGFLQRNGFQVIFALPGMVLATVFPSLPLVVREVVPVLEEIGTEQEQAAMTLGASSWQTFRRITLPAIRWALAYGVILSLARSLGEFGAVKVVSGNLINQTQTVTLIVEEKYQNFEQATAYAASFVLAAIAIVCLIIVTIIRPKEGS